MTTTRLEIFAWDENFATGIEEVDAQHKQLVHLLNVLVSHLAFNAEAPALNQVFDELKAYTVAHFSTEERIWREYFQHDPWEAWHRDAHNDFIARVIELKRNEAELPLDDVITQIVSFLTHWLALHIIESDKRMAKVVLALASGISLERAKEQANEEMAGATRILINTVLGMYDTLAKRTIQLTREISRRVKAEAQLRAAQEEMVRTTNAAVVASQSKSLFLANMVHEIRTPMSGMIGMTEVLLKTSLSGEQRRMARTIRDSAQAQLDIHNDILDISKIEAGKLSLSNEPFALADMVEKTCDTLAEHARKHAVTLHHDADPSIPKTLKGDAQRVRQILTNFTSHAIKVSSGRERSGRVEVTTRLAGEEGGRVWVELSVRDNGIGLDAATLDRVFHPFIQAGASTTRDYGGTGLGLVISARLAEAMGGEIRAQSVPEAGSTFTARLPFDRADELKLAAATEDPEQPAHSQPALPSREEAIGQGRLILVAEDNDTNLEVIRQQLGMLGYQCDVARDGREVFSKWLTGVYGLIISDIHMPDMDGYQLTAAIRTDEAKHGAGHTPILALTANVLEGEAERCLHAGMDGCLGEPVSVAKSKAMIDKYLAKPKIADMPPFSIMVVDDEPFMHDLMTYMLEELGHTEVSCHESGEAALAALDGHGGHGESPDAILLDINMPGMDGIEVVEQLARRRYSGCLILVSGEDDLMLRTTEKLAQENDLFVPGSVRKPPMLDRVGDLLRRCCPHDTRSAKPPAKSAHKNYDAAALRQAIVNGELVNYYQPKVALPGGEWIGVETLVRWKHPRDGLVFPDQFIPVAEAEGLIGDVTRVVFADAIRQARQWRDEGLDISVAVNVSMEDLTDALALTGFDPPLLTGIDPLS